MDIAEIREISKKCNNDIVETAIAFEREKTGKTTETLYENMEKMWIAMKKSAHKGVNEPVYSKSSMTGCEGYKLYSKSHGEYEKAAAIAMGVANINSAMGRIVAAPTAGSCGILPGVLCIMKERTGCDDKKIVAALFAAGLIGEFIADKASIAGACHGCQAECGSASAMAAAAAVWLCGGTIDQSFDAAAMSLKAIMGLVCDPVAGLVEVPCIKRNAFGAAEAILAADMALAGIKSVIPFDETVMAMKQAGELMNDDLKETSRGGLAVTKTAKEWEQKL